MLLKNIELYVFKMDNETFEMIGEINQYTSLMWPDKFNGFTSFELNAPITLENKALIKEGNVLWCGGDNAAVIEIIQSDTNEEGQKTYKVKGRTLEFLLTTRIIWGTYQCTNKLSSTAIYEIVNEHCINPSDAKRKIPFLELAEDEKFGKKISYQKTGGEVYESITNICSDSELGFCVLFRPKERKLIFKVLYGVERNGKSEVNKGSKLVIFSTDMEDILTSSYYTNSQDVKTTALVAGEGEDAGRKRIISGDNSLEGFLRKELYVDARDLQSEVSNEDGTFTTISDSEYEDMLDSRGSEKLSEHVKTETFDAKMRVIGDVQYTYNVDYFKGDKVIVRDMELGVQAIATVSEVSENYDDEYEFIITFGYSYPTLIQKIKQQIL